MNKKPFCIKSSTRAVAALKSFPNTAAFKIKPFDFDVLDVIAKEINTKTLTGYINQAEIADRLKLDPKSGDAGRMKVSRSVKRMEAQGLINIRYPQFKHNGRKVYGSAHYSINFINILSVLRGSYPQMIFICELPETMPKQWAEIHKPTKTRITKANAHKKNAPDSKKNVPAKKLSVPANSVEAKKAKPAPKTGAASKPVTHPADLERETGERQIEIRKQKDRLECGAAYAKLTERFSSEEEMRIPIVTQHKFIPAEEMRTRSFRQGKTEEVPTPCTIENRCLTCGYDTECMNSKIAYRR